MQNNFIEYGPPDGNNAFSAASHPSPAASAQKLLGLGTLFGSSSPMQKLYGLIQRVGPTAATVFITGESGSGKEGVAQALHQTSRRAALPFIAVNCSAMPASLVEAELFGYEKGSFTGADRQHLGCFERAGEGTLFLDEITEMPIALQATLLRVLETRRFRRVGGSTEIECRARIVAATNQVPAEAVAQRKLREDLLYRLSVFPLAVPPLRERGEDIVELAQHFLAAFNRESGASRRLPQDLTLLTGHSWPGNVRELKNLLQRAHILAEDELEFDGLIDLRTDRAGLASAPAVTVAVGTPLAVAERQIIEATLERCHGSRQRTAKMLGVSLKTLYNRLIEYGRETAVPAAAEVKGTKGTKGTSTRQENGNVVAGPWHRPPALPGPQVAGLG